MEKLIAFNGNAKLKKMLVDEIEVHRKADEIVKGTYGKQEGNKFKLVLLVVQYILLT